VIDTSPAHLATIRRGEALEAVVRGHVAVVDSEGTVLARAGDSAAVTTVRSCVKPVQAIPFVRRALAELAATSEELAVACASHNGEPEHVAAVRSLLGRAGVDEHALSCAPHLPYDGGAARDLLASGRLPGRVHNNCSGKHAAMLAVCRVAGWPLDGYAAYGHPLQVEVRRVMSGLAGTDLDAQPWGVDGCGLPTHGLGLEVLARMFAAAAADPDFRRCQDAMAAHPHLVAGSARFDTALLAAAGDTLTAKIGGAAVWVAVRRPAGPALAVKLEAGEASAMPAIALAALSALGWLDEVTAASGELAPFRQPALRNWAGDEVGSITAEAAWTVPLRSCRATSGLRRSPVL
jgi:L-asparaginase II